ncbi:MULTISPECIES: amidohydrolase family protein [unclassified Chelatococcus]|uniref:amidohydrolase family protein n=1 Tax=unclassified Chelatococcus TaxID=2638111 RepID=UPI001BD127BF|nr:MULTISPECIES: amidohydrolase family protein [unclassified Chelatococcus]MBS7700649.1 amidohydrolase family protein [Chelatococcus sp. YT9]MBX3559080.1 amidohydrolase family protein [Chelatococcus sp.]
MTVIDAHQHVWRLGQRDHIWPAKALPVLARNFTPADLNQLMHRAQVDGTILMQSLNDPDETREFLRLAAVTPWISGVVGWVPLAGPEATANAIHALPHRDKLVGIRHLINFEPNPSWLLQPAVQEAIGVVAAQGLVFDVVPNDAARFDAVLATAERHPDMTMVIDHLARPPVVTGGWEPWASQIARAGQLPNIYIKLSVGLDIALEWSWAPDELRQYVDHVLEHFGPGRIMAASNWPVSTLTANYTTLWKGIRALISGLKPHESAMVLGGTAIRAFGLGTAAGDCRISKGQRA